MLTLGFPWGAGHQTGCSVTFPSAVCSWGHSTRRVITYVPSAAPGPGKSHTLASRLGALSTTGWSERKHRTGRSPGAHLARKGTCPWARQRVSYQFLVGWQKGSGRTQLWEAWLLEPQTPDPKPPKIGHLSRGDGPSWPTSPKATPNPRARGAENLWALGCSAGEGIGGGSQDHAQPRPGISDAAQEGFYYKRNLIS